METIEYRDLVDKSEWSDGPWMSEPDKKQWLDSETGLPCLIVRSHLGFLCGYAGVPRGHRAYGQHYDDVHGMTELQVHGGLTYASHCSGNICHKVDSGEDDSTWWLGFDAGHCQDYSPGMEATRKIVREKRLSSGLEGLGDPWKDDVYRDLAYVEGEVSALARQLKALKPVTWRNWPYHICRGYYMRIKNSRLGWRYRMWKMRKFTWPMMQRIMKDADAAKGR